MKNKGLYRRWLSASCCTLIAGTGLGACQRQSDGAADATARANMAVATRALEATADYRVVASDAQRGLLTVRSTRTGELRLIDLNDAARAAEPQPPHQATAAISVAAAPAVTASAGTVAAPVAVEPAAERATAPAKAPRYQIVHVGGAGQSAPSVAAPVAAAITALTDVSIDHAVICRAGEHLRLRQVHVSSASAGIVLQSGCQLELIDSEVLSGDVALVVNAGATLRIENSIIRGRTGSIQAAASTHVASWASTFAGPTVLDGAEFVDRGGNSWQ